MTRTPSGQVVRRIRDAAHSLLSEAGAAAVAPTVVAARAEVSVQTVYNRFGSIDGLLDDIATVGYRRLTDQVIGRFGSPLSAAGDPLAVLIEAFRRYRNFAVAEPELHRFLFGEAVGGYQPSARTIRARSETLDLFVAVTERAITAGQLLSGEPAEIAGRFWSVTNGALTAERSSRQRHDIERDNAFEATMATLIRGLRTSESAQLR